MLRQRPPLPGVRHGLSLRPPGAAHGSPSQVQCCTLAGITSKRKSLQKQPKRRKPRLCLDLLLFGIRQRPTLPGRLQPSTIGAERLNFCVRYGNRWIPFAIVTGMLSRVCAVLRLLGFRDVHCKPSLLSWRRSAHLALLSSIARTLKTAHPDFLPSCLHQFLPCLLASISFLDQVLDRLVSPSSIRYRTSTGDLSPGSLPGVLLLSNGTLLLEVGFTLRCLQRLSAPHFASQLCRWHDNCCTSDASTPVLSY